MSEFERKLGFKRGDWFIEYEIPPLRAIYHAHGSPDATRQEILMEIEKEEPSWNIRKIYKVR